MDQSYDETIVYKVNLLKNYFDSLVQYVCCNQDNVDSKQKEKMEKTIATITSLGPLVNSIQDKVFLKQLKNAKISSIECKFDYGIDNINNLMNSLKYDIDCINKSKVPLWLSNTIYFFDHNWRKQVYQKIMITYSKIKDYLKNESENDVLNANLSKNSYYKKAKDCVLQSFANLLKEINEEIINKPINLE